MIFGCLTLLFILVLAVSEGSQETTGGRHEGDTLRLLPKFTFYARARKPKLIFLGRGGFIPLNGYSPARVQRACEAQGWRFDGHPALAVKDVQDWLHSGLSLDAVQLLMTFGPFPGAAADNEPHTSLEAAVFEDLGDKFTAPAGATPATPTGGRRGCSARSPGTRRRRKRPPAGSRRRPCGLPGVGLRIVEQLALSGVPAVVVDDNPAPALARMLAAGRSARPGWACSTSPGCPRSRWPRSAWPRGPRSRSTESNPAALFRVITGRGPQSGDAARQGVRMRPVTVRRLGTLPPRQLWRPACW